MPDEDIHKQQTEDRTRYTGLILDSVSKKKIVVAGAGTGKSFTFQALLRTKGNNSLALTFINNLTQDLIKDLSGLADVYTFHGYCRSILHKIPVDGINSKFHYFPKLPKIISSDSVILETNLDGFEKAIQTLEEGKEIEFYIKQSNYYNAVGHNDSVYRVLIHFRANPGVIPKYNQIVVDEYQDFNPLEVEFIEQLSLANPLLIAGDDDQAIYGWKHASPEHIRKKATDAEFELFELPYCSRCTEVIVEAVSDITKKAKTVGCLNDRIDKKYICFLPQKEADSKQYPQIIHANCSLQTKKLNYIGKFIETEINKIPQAEIDLARKENYPCVLIVGSGKYTKQVLSYLKDKFTNIEFKESKNEEIELIDAYNILIRDKDSNLGWRIVLEFSEEKTKTDVIKKANQTGDNLVDLLEANFKEKHLKIVEIIRKIYKQEENTDEEVKLLKENTDLSVEQIKELSAKTEETVTPESTDNSISIRFTTINGCKGMSAGYVFIVGMNNGDIPKDPSKPTDDEICQLVVALTRTRKQCYLVSNRSLGMVRGIKPSSFIDWIDSARIDNIAVDAAYFKALPISS